MKKAISFVCALVLIWGLAGCGAQSKPDTVVNTFCSAMKAYDRAGMSKCLTSGGDSLTEDNGEADALSQDLFDYLKTCASQMTYTVQSSSVQDNKGTVTVKFSYVDASPVVTAALGAYMQQGFVMALSGADDTAMTQLFTSVFNEKKDSVKTGTAEATLTFACTKTDSGWMIDSLPDGTQSVLLSNADKAFSALDSDSGTDDKDVVWHDVPMGQTAVMATVNICVTGYQETASLSSQYAHADAQEGTKFVILDVTVENITKDPLPFDSDSLPLSDSQGRHFSTYQDAFQYTDESFLLTTLSPNIKQSGQLIYNVPQDTAGCYLAVLKSGTNDGYRLLTK